MFLETRILLDKCQCAYGKPVVCYSGKNKILYKTMTAQIFTGETSNNGRDVVRSKDKRRIDNLK